MGIFAWMKGKRGNPPLPEKAPPALGYRTASVQGIGSREDQEDAFLFVNDRDVVRTQQEGLFAVVADGMGGMASGQEASAIAIASLSNSFSSFDRGEALAPQLRQALCEASGKVFQRLGGLGGSTAIVCLVFREQLWFACVGDSPLYLLRDQQLNRLNQEHTVCTQRYEEALLSGSTDPSSARNDPQSHAITSFLGREELDQVDCLLRPLPLQAGDVLLLCSDGVSGTLSEETLLACLQQETPEYSCIAMEQEIRKRDRIIILPWSSAVKNKERGAPDEKENLILSVGRNFAVGGSTDGICRF